MDGHAVLASENVLNLAGITSESKIAGGEIVLFNGKPTGVLIDEAESLIQPVIPKYSKEFKLNSLKIAQEDCFALGLTTVCDGGLSKKKLTL